MRKRLSVLLILAAIFALASCSIKTPNYAESSEPQASEATTTGESTEPVDIKSEFDSATNMKYKLNDDEKSYSVYA